MNPAINDINTNKSNELLNSLIQKIPWSGVKNIFSNRKKLMTKFKKGGYRLVQKNKTRAIQVICDGCKEEDYHFLFYNWYENRPAYTDLLEPYFDSEDYLDWSEEQNIKEGEYALPDLVFEKLCAVLISEHALFFLHFSPIKFTEKQVEVLTNLPASIKPEDLDPKGTIEEKTRKKGLNNKNGNLKKERNQYIENKIYYKEKEHLKKSNNRIKQLLKEKKLLKDNERINLKEIEKLKRKIDELNNEQKNLKDENKQHLKKIANLKRNIDKKVERISKELENLREAKTIIEKQADGLNKQLEKSTLIVNAQSVRIKNLQKELVKVKEQKTTCFIKILSLIDMKGLIDELNEPDDVKELLSTVVVPPTNDDHASDQKQEETIKNFWNGLIEREKIFIKDIIEIDAISVMNSSYFKNWGTKADYFVDLKYSLRARAVLVNLIYEILRQQQ